MKKITLLFVSAGLFALTILLLLLKQIMIAKIIGITLLVAIAVVLWVIISKSISQTTKNQLRININHQFTLNELSPYYRTKTNAQKKVLNKQLIELIKSTVFLENGNPSSNERAILAASMLLLLADKHQHNNWNRVVCFTPISDAQHAAEMSKALCLQPEELIILLKKPIEELKQDVLFTAIAQAR
jgi:Ca2+/Na+ antiporter